MNNNRVLAIGNAIVDIVCKIEDDFLKEKGFVKGSMSLIDNETAEELSNLNFEKITSGGSASNTVAALGKLGTKSAFIGKVGHDEFGEKFIAELKKEKIEFLSDIHLKKPSARSFILVSEDAQRTMCTFLGCAPEILESDVKNEYFKHATILYLEGYLWDSKETILALKKAIRLAKENNVKIAFSLSDLFCVSRHKKDFLDLIKNDLDIVFCNIEEAKELGNYQEIFFSNQNLIAAVTNSENGCEVFSQNQSIQVSAQKIENVVDTTGAGDVFAAGFLHELLNGSSPEFCAIKANEVAGKIIQQFGARF